MLIVIDNSPSMAQEQPTIVEQLGYVVDFYEGEQFRLDYRLGVTTTEVSHPGCEPTSEGNGALVATSCRSRIDEFVVGASMEGAAADIRDEACLDWCSLDALPLTGGPWVERIEGVSNVAPGVEPAEVFQCLAAQGVRGCAFESPLEAMREALLRAAEVEDPMHAFLRPDASLFILFITDEPDCSWNPEHANAFEADATSAACWHAGVECTGPDDALLCASAPVDESLLHPMSRYSGMLSALADRKRSVRAENGVFVSLIGGAPELATSDPFETHYATSTDPAHADAFGVAPGCSSEIGEAQPPVRLRELTEEFYDRFQIRPMAPLCRASSFLGALACVPSAYRPPSGCLSDCVGDDVVATDVQPSDCSVVEVRRDGTQRPLPPCIDPLGDPQIPDSASGCAIVRVGDVAACESSNVDIDVLWTTLPDASCVRVVCNRSLHRAIDCPSMEW